METFIRHGGLPPQYRCDLFNNWTDERWLQEGTQRTVLGIYDLVFGIICTTLYIPCCIVLLQPELRRFVAYKLLFHITICEMYLLLLNSILSGIFFIKGSVFCNYPMLFYLLGSIALPAWMGLCSGGCLLGLTRLVDLWSPKLHDSIFGGKRTVIWLLSIFTYMFLSYLYGKPILFNSKLMTWTFDPFIYTDGSHGQEYISYITVLNNEITVTLTVIFNITFMISFFYKSIFLSFKFTTPQKQMFVQSTFASFNIFMTAGIFVAYMFTDGSLWLNYLGLQFWQLATAGDLVLFLGVNATTRRGVLDLLRRWFFMSKRRNSAVSPLKSSANMSPV